FTATQGGLVGHHARGHVADRLPRVDGRRAVLCHGLHELVYQVGVGAAVAVGEPLRTRYQFREWIERRALDIAQPDVARCGITEGKRIADLAATYHLPVAYHVGVCLGVAMAATWHLAAATPNFYIQEHEPPMFDLANRLFKEPLRVEGGHAVVPEGPGLGVDIDVETLRQWTTQEGDRA
ncbi:MAG: hypothetical protein EXS64_19615, partial [Candidatus Latescibacteria bacterium]|nr:hypothetical protein [Candidatus Latescibacterota bacterium]